MRVRGGCRGVRAGASERVVQGVRAGASERGDAGGQSSSNCLLVLVRCLLSGVVSSVGVAHFLSIYCRWSRLFFLLVAVAVVFPSVFRFVNVFLLLLYVGCYLHVFIFTVGTPPLLASSILFLVISSGAEELSIIVVEKLTLLSWHCFFSSFVLGMWAGHVSMICSMSHGDIPQYSPGFPIFSIVGTPYLAVLIFFFLWKFILFFFLYLVPLHRVFCL